MSAYTFSLLWGALALLVVAAGGQGSCGPPSRLNFAELIDEHKSKTSFPVGSTVKYRCRPGYYGFRNSVTCLESLKWSEATILCKRKQCPNLKELDNGRFHLEDRLLGSTVNFICDEGHRLIGQSSMQCIIADQKVIWNGGIPQCQRIPCYPPPDILHGKHNGRYDQDYYYGTAVTYTCDKNYPLVGDASIHCTTKDGENGVWSGRVSCGVTPCPSPQVENGRIVAGHSGTYAHKHKVTLGCSAGHIITGSREIYCQADGTWDPPVPLCERVMGCIGPAIQNGRITSLKALFMPREIITFECDPGYVLQGTQKIQCRSDSTWDSPIPICVKGRCGPPPSLNFAELTNEYKNKTSFPVGSIVKYDCRPGYSRFRTSSVECLSNLTWSGTDEFCKKISCGHPGEPENGRLIVSDDILLGSTVNFTCEEGHKLIGQSFIQCVLSGQKVKWSSKIPFCQRIKCHPPPDIPHGKHNGRYNQDYYYGTAVTYTCDKSYPHVGDAYIYCTTKDGENGVWSGHTVCGETPCPAPQVENGRIVAGHSGTYAHKHKVTLGCSAGHVITGSREIYCQADGTWDPPVPLCERVSQCPVPPDITHGNHNATAGEMFTSLMSVTYFCDPGYLLIGKAYISCTASGNWSLPLPHCEVQCSTPQRITNGEYTSQALEVFTKGAFVEYSCNPGYRLMGEAIIYCTESGSWSSRTPSCEAIQCHRPPQVKNGFHSNQESVVFSNGMCVKYTCEDGYTLIGAATIHCTESGTWNHSAPRCEELQCTPPPSISNGEHNGHGLAHFPVGTRVNYACNPGYLLVGEASSHCTTVGAWSQPTPQCEVMRCPPPPRIVHGRYFGGNFTYQMRVIYVCDAGYSLVGDPVVTCTLQGLDATNWTQPPKCKGCPAPQEIANGKPDTDIQEDFAYGSIVTYHCEAGYFPTGATSIYCLSSGLWDPPTPQCKVIQCHRPPAIQNGFLSNQESAVFMEGMSVKYTCEQGYNLTGEATIYCTQSGTWSHPAPFCKETSCICPVIQNGRTTTSKLSVKPIETIEFECDPGYILEGNHKIQCQSNGMWEPPVPICVNGSIDIEISQTLRSSIGSQCPSPPHIDNGYHIGEAFYVFPAGTSVSYSCISGYILIGQKSISCTESGVWSFPPPRCEAIQCHRPPQVKNGFHSNQESVVFSNGMCVKYTCEDGYTLIGAATIHCTESGTWNHSAPRCEELQCTPPPSISNGEHNGHGLAHFPVGTRVNYACNPGYLLVGEASTHCTTVGAWSQPTPQCEVMRCPPPPRIVHGRYFGGNFTYQMRVIYVCDAGYSLVGDPVVTCTLQGLDATNWTQPPKCKGCLPPQEIANGKHDADVQGDFAYGSSVTYLCDPGYFPTGATTVYCLSSGVWDPSVPQCNDTMLSLSRSEDILPIGCILPQIPGGKKAEVENVFQSGDNVTVECEDGYVLEGNSYVQCQHDFTWDPPVPVCKPGFYVTGLIMFGSVVGFLLLLAIFGITWITKWNKVRYTLANSKEISDSPNSRIRPSNLNI